MDAQELRVDFNGASLARDLPVAFFSEAISKNGVKPQA
jgi:hypothetical protein